MLTSASLRSVQWTASSELVDDFVGLRSFVAGGLPAALNDKGWPGPTPKFTGEVEAQLIALACSDPPEGAARWTLRLLARRMIELEYVDYISHVTVRELLKKTDSSLGV